jgi:hypothetical protein
MPLLNFQKQFVEAVELGIADHHAQKVADEINEAKIDYARQMTSMPLTMPKRQTIRAYRKDKRDPKKGDTLYLYTGLRTKHSKKLGEVECLHVHHIIIEKHALQLPLLHDGQDTVINLPDCLDTFAERDGFKDWAEMAAWFDKTHGLPFKGLLIGW